MAQVFPTSAQAVYDILSTTPAFMDALGTYEFRAGATAPAISIVTPGADLPALRKVQGIECVIQDVGNFSKSEYLTGEPARLTITWSVFIVCWEPANGADLQQATEAAAARFLNCEAVQTVAVADGLGAQVQTKLMIRSDMPVLAA